MFSYVFYAHESPWKPLIIICIQNMIRVFGSEYRIYENYFFCRNYMNYHMLEYTIDSHGFQYEASGSTSTFFFTWPRGLDQLIPCPKHFQFQNLIDSNGGLRHGRLEVARGWGHGDLKTPGQQGWDDEMKIMAGYLDQICNLMKATCKLISPENDRITNAIPIRGDNW